MDLSGGVIPLASAAFLGKGVNTLSLSHKAYQGNASLYVYTLHLALTCRGAVPEVEKLQEAQVLGGMLG